MSEDPTRPSSAESEELLRDLAETIRRELVCGCIEASEAGEGKADPFCKGAELAARIVESSVTSPGASS